MKLFTKLGLLCLMLFASNFAMADSVTTTWDWNTNYPEGIIDATSIEGNVGYVNSDVEGIQLYVDATNGKLQGRSSGDAQFNAGTIIQVPVTSTTDVVTVTSYPGYYYYTVAGTAATGDVTTYTAKSNDVSQGYVEIIATDNAYLYSITVVQNNEDLPTLEGTTAVWDWYDDIPEGIVAGTNIEGFEDELASSVEGINLYVDATASGAKLSSASRTNDVQFNSGTILRIPVYSTNDEITIISYPGYYHFSYGGIAAVKDETICSPSKKDVQNEYFEIVSTGDAYLRTISVTYGELNESDYDIEEDEEDENSVNVTAYWDFQNNNPNGIRDAATFEGVEGELASSINGVSMTVDATEGKLYCGASRDNAQFTAGTKLYVPVKSTYDIVTVKHYPSYIYYTVGGVEATSEDEPTTYKAKVADVERGYVIVEAYKECYLYSVNVYFGSSIQEKALYTTDWTEWSEIDRTQAVDVQKTVSTRYSHEDLTFTFTGVGVYPEGKNTDNKFSYIGFMETAKYDGEFAVCEPYAITSPLASLSRIDFTQCATGGNRGIKISVKGDGDDDWVIIHNVSISSQSGEDLSYEINRTNCQIKFEAFTLSQNAYVPYLKLYGMVDMSEFPALGSFSVNGVKYEAGDIFNEDNEGNMVATVEIFNSETMISSSNPIGNVDTDNGELGEITYELQEDGSTIVTIPVTFNGETINYILTVIKKPYYTVSYYNTDGNIIDSNLVEKDTEIGEFIVDESKVTVSEGYAFRGWFVEPKQGTRKYTTEEIITEDINLYALETEIETANGSSRYKFDLTSEYFYAEDHEAFNPTNGEYYNNHGWTFTSEGTIDILVGTHAYINFTLCQYGNGCNLTLYDVDGSEYATINGRSSTDGGSESIEYIGEGGTLTIKTDAQYYLHGITISNVADNPVEKNEQGYFVVVAGDAGHLLTTLEIANATANSSERTYVFVPDGVYELGNTNLTPISGNNISIIGQSMDNTIIRNTSEEEGIGVTATFYITGSNTYLQDLTLQNAYPYYTAGGSAGRAVCIQDRGNHTICKNVRMLSYQDTYYSNTSNGELYWETSDIHGTVDFLCGEGAVYYNQCTITVEPRNADGSGSCTITAPSTYKNQRGYIFESCTIDNLAASFNYGRTWNNDPECVYLNTTIINDEGLIANRWTLEGMGIPAERFYEYNTMNAAGTRISPDTFSPVFIKSGYEDSQYETILTDEQAAEYALDKVFPSWTPAEYTVQTEMGSLSLEDNTLSWQEPENSLGVYAIFHNDEFVDMVSGTSYVVTESGDYTVRAANEYGGFGSSSDTATGITSKVVDGKVVRTAYYNLQGARVGQSYKGIVIKVDTLEDGSQVARKIIAK